MIDLLDKGTLGEIISDADGLSLYFFTKDVAGESECSEGGLFSLPIFYMRDLATGTRLSIAYSANITRSDGRKQRTYKGWPLY
jgi:predicted lipoprotein with Yx(FWY)xxD motif